MIRTMLTAVVVAGFIAGAVFAQDEAAADKPEEKAWETTLAVGLDLTHGNSDTMLSSASLRTEHEEGAHNFRAGVEGAYGETEVTLVSGETQDETTARNAKAMANYKLKAEIPYLYVDATWEHDDIADVDYRFIGGPGAGTTIVNRDALKLEADVGVAYVNEDVGGLSDDYASLRASEYVKWQISESAKLWQEAVILPRADDLDDFLLTVELGVEAALNATLSLRLVVQDKYDSTPAEGQVNNDVSVVSALTWQLR
jgi:putative salt-induced outer membrane protein YdiY